MCTHNPQLDPVCPNIRVAEVLASPSQSRLLNKAERGGEERERKEKEGRRGGGGEVEREKRHQQTAPSSWPECSVCQQSPAFLVKRYTRKWAPVLFSSHDPLT